VLAWPGAALAATGAPTGLTATTPTKLKPVLSWTAPATVGAGIAGYNVYRGATKANATVIPAATTTYTDSGAVANSTLMQLQADLSGVSVLRPQAPDLSALGAAHLAGLAAGWWSLDGLDALSRPRDEFTPVASPDWRDRELTSWRAAIQRARYQPQREDQREDPKEGP